MTNNATAVIAISPNSRARPGSGVTLLEMGCIESAISRGANHGVKPIRRSNLSKGTPGHCPRILAELTDSGQPDPVGPLLPHGPNSSPVRGARHNVEDMRTRMKFRSPLGCGERKDGPRSSRGPTGSEIWTRARSDAPYHRQLERQLAFWLRLRDQSELALDWIHGPQIHGICGKAETQKPRAAVGESVIRSALALGGRRRMFRRVQNVQILVAIIIHVKMGRVLFLLS